jgi:hypothetical protein
MAALISASVRSGTSRAGRDGAWITSGGVVAEGPLLDLLLRQGSTVLRPATALERLLGQTP